MISLIRYPGSKAKLVGQICKFLPHAVRFELLAATKPTEYREPFFGAGAIGFEVLSVLMPECSIWLNDIDPGMVALWRTVRNDPKSLVRRCNSFKPSAKWFYEFKESDGDTSIDESKAAFRKLALHRMSFSGMGAMAGGPIGGRDQDNAKYDVACRWNAENIKLQVGRAHRLLMRFASLRITCLDWSRLTADATPETFIYLDPPYYEKGPQLYKYSMDDAAHARLADRLMSLNCRWLLSYDDHPRVRELYAGCEFRELKVTYTTATSRAPSRPKNSEVVILPAMVGSGIIPCIEGSL